MGLTQDPITSQDRGQMMDLESDRIDPAMCVLDVLRYDIEPIDSIIRLLNDDGCIGWRHLRESDFTVQDVLPLLKRLVAEGLVDVYERNHDESELIPVDVGKIDIDRRVDEYWYVLTPAGREAWEAWDPPVTDE
jgi:hypothetical protein